jgi:hypothetical protein
VKRRCKSVSCLSVASFAHPALCRARANKAVLMDSDRVSRWAPSADPSQGRHQPASQGRSWRVRPETQPGKAGRQPASLPCATPAGCHRACSIAGHHAGLAARSDLQVVHHTWASEPVPSGSHRPAPTARPRPWLHVRPSSSRHKQSLSVAQQVARCTCRAQGPVGVGAVPHLPCAQRMARGRGPAGRLRGVSLSAGVAVYVCVRVPA